MTPEANRLADLLGLTLPQRESLRVKFVKHHGQQKAPAKLEGYLCRLWAGVRDEVRLLGKATGYQCSPVTDGGAFHGAAIGSWDDNGPEPEAVNDATVLRGYAQAGEVNRSVTQAGRRARLEERSVAKKVQLAIAEADGDIENHLAQIRAEIRAMQAAA